MKPEQYKATRGVRFVTALWQDRTGGQGRRGTERARVDSPVRSTTVSPLSSPMHSPLHLGEQAYCRFPWRAPPADGWLGLGGRDARRCSLFSVAGPSPARRQALLADGWVENLQCTGFPSPPCMQHAARSRRSSGRCLVLPFPSMQP